MSLPALSYEAAFGATRQYDERRITSAGGELSSMVHDRRSYQCHDEALEVVGNPAICALGEFGVQTIPLD